MSVELNIIVTPGGILKTQLIAPEEEQPEGFRLYERVLPHIRRINAELTRPARTSDSEESERRSHAAP